jgi:hypothetical protein
MFRPDIEALHSRVHPFVLPGFEIVGSYLIQNQVAHPYREGCALPEKDSKRKQQYKQYVGQVFFHTKISPLSVKNSGERL